MDVEIHGAVTNGNVHISNTALLAGDITRPLVNFGWFLNDKDGRRNVDGGIRAIKKYYAQLTSNEAAFHFLGSGRDSSNNVVARDPDCARESLLANVQLSANIYFTSNISEYFVSNVGGVYNRGYKGLNIENASYDTLKNMMLNTNSIRESIHWSGSVSYGKATDKDFIVKGTRNVRCCCSAVITEPFPHNNWCITTQWGRYIAMHALGLTTIVKPESRIALALSNAEQEIVKFVLPGVANSNLTVTNYNPDTSNLTYYITKDGVVFPPINAKFTAAKASGSNFLCNFRTINDRYNGYDIPVTNGNYSNADCGIMQSKLQLEFAGITVVPPAPVSYEWLYSGFEYSNSTNNAWSYSPTAASWFMTDINNVANSNTTPGAIQLFAFSNTNAPTSNIIKDANNNSWFVYSPEKARAMVGRPYSASDIANMTRIFPTRTISNFFLPNLLLRVASQPVYYEWLYNGFEYSNSTNNAWSYSPTAASWFMTDINGVANSNTTPGARQLFAFNSNNTPTTTTIKDAANNTWFVYSPEKARALTGRPYSAADIANMTRIFPTRTIDNFFLPNLLLRLATRSNYLWTDTGITWVYSNVFIDAGLGNGAKKSPLDTTPTSNIDGITPFALDYMVKTNPLWTKNFLISNSYAVVNPWKNENGTPGMSVKQLNLSLSAYDAEDKFVDSIAGVPLQPGMVRFPPAPA